MTLFSTIPRNTLAAWPTQTEPNERQPGRRLDVKSLTTRCVLPDLGSPDSKYPVAVWVGHPDKLVRVTTDFNNGPILGGTFPTLIWHDFTIDALNIDKSHAEASGQRKNAPRRGIQKNLGGQARDPSSTTTGGGDT